MLLGGDDVGTGGGPGRAPAAMSPSTREKHIMGVLIAYVKADCGGVNCMVEYATLSIHTFIKFNCWQAFTFVLVHAASADISNHVVLDLDY